MSKKANIEDLEKEYKLLVPIYSDLCIELETELNEIIKSAKIEIAIPIHFRIKTFDSIYEKVSSGRFNIKKSVTELQDISGLRIVTLFKRDTDKIIELINKNYVVIKIYNTSEKLKEMEFGYSSTHIVCKLKDDYINLLHNNLLSKNFEIQLRTLSQHNWAEASNFFQYKKENDIPKQLKRSINRISALLEIVDLEFERLLFDRELYIKSEIKDDENLNIDILGKILDEFFPNNKYSRQDISSLLIELASYKIKSVNELRDLIDKHLTAIIKIDKLAVKGILKNKSDNVFYNEEKKAMINLGYFYSQVALVRLIIGLDRKI
ncbi:GTP pyrophosphokinase family protein [Epilithonimonas zeae]|uniref:GTP pyrophosphokinase n=1 Tax=Epilithonimonas zeae TaxID=1416779 RepID=UPI00200E9464|nr:hypothetical protein [Epilithonimonas zeae]UQB69508.1 hypothetical protein KI430_03515 [Epilithonimonas zeae]